MSSSGLTPQQQAAVETAVKRLNDGGLVIYPTETFYGLGAAVSRPQALRRLVMLKGRDAIKPLPIIVAEAADAAALWADIPEPARLLMHRFWPGPLTIVLPARPGLPFEIAPRGSVGIRVSPHPIAREIARRVGPIVATSANPSGQKEAMRVSELNPTLRESVDYVLDGGKTQGPPSSTVLAFQGGKATILRDGPVQRAVIMASLPEGLM